MILRSPDYLHHHGHIRPVLIRDWPPEMDGIAATIWASQTDQVLGRRRYLDPSSRDLATSSGPSAEIAT